MKTFNNYKANFKPKFNRQNKLLNNKTTNFNNSKANFKSKNNR